MRYYLTTAIAYANNIDPLHFWMMVLVAFELGYLLPPVAINQLLTRQVIGEEGVKNVAAYVRQDLAGLKLPRFIAVILAFCVMGGLAWILGRTVSRNITGATTPSRPATSLIRASSSSESDTSRRTPARSAASISATDLLLPCTTIREPGIPARSATASSPPAWACSWTSRSWASASGPGATRRW